jgi:hypothetical protein
MPWVGTQTHSTSGPMLLPAACLAALCLGAVVASIVMGKLPPPAPLAAR